MSAVIGEQISWAIVWKAGSSVTRRDIWEREKPDCWSDIKANRWEFTDEEEARHRMNLAKVANRQHNRSFRLVKITRKPRLSPEAKAARDALCVAAVAWWMAPNRTDVDETRTLNTAIRDYAGSVTT